MFNIISFLINGQRIIDYICLNNALIYLVGWLVVLAGWQDIFSLKEVLLQIDKFVHLKILYLIAYFLSFEINLS